MTLLVSVAYSSGPCTLAYTSGVEAAVALFHRLPNHLTPEIYFCACSGHFRTSSRELEATTGAAAHNLKNINDDLSSLDLGIYEARDLAQNRPLAEWSSGRVWATRSNPTHQLTDTTQPNPLRVGKFGPNPTQPNTSDSTQQKITDTGVYHL